MDAQYQMLQEGMEEAGLYSFDPILYNLQHY